MIRFFREQDFVRDYGSLEGDELQERPGTIPQVLLRMNGRLTRELGEANPLTSIGRIAALAPDDEIAVEAIFLACLTRLPTAEERQHFVSQLQGTELKSRARTVELKSWISSGVWSIPLNSPGTTN